MRVIAASLVIGAGCRDVTVACGMRLVWSHHRWTDTEVIVTFVADGPLQGNSGSGYYSFTVWLVTPEGRILATLESYDPGGDPFGGHTAGILDEEPEHGHPDWFSGVTNDIEGSVLEQRWSRSRLEAQLRGVGVDGLPEVLEWFATTGAGMHGPDALNPSNDGWFDRCPDN